MATMETKLYRIHWRSKAGKTGNGTQSFTKEVAQRLAAKENEIWNGLVEHWIEPVPALPAPSTKDTEE